MADEKNTGSGGLRGLADKAKEFMTDDRIDQAAEKIKGVAPESVDKHVDSVADKAKDMNADETQADETQAGESRPDESRSDDRNTGGSDTGDRPRPDR